MARRKQCPHVDVKTNVETVKGVTKDIEITTQICNDCHEQVYRWVKEK